MNETAQTSPKAVAHLQELAVALGSRFDARLQVFWSKSAAMAVLAGMGLLLTGCSGTRNLQVVLEKDSTVKEGTPVYVDEIRAGKVTFVGEEGGERVANLAIGVGPAKERLKEGVVRIPEDGRIQISTSGVKADAAALPNGARIPTGSGVLDLIRHYSKGSTLAATGVAFLVLLGVFLLFRSLVGAVGLVISVALAGIFTQAVYLNAVPWVTQIYARFPPPAVAKAVATGTEPGASTAAGIVKSATETIREVMVMRPDPQILTWCVVFIVLFIILNLLLGRVARVWRK